MNQVSGKGPARTGAFRIDVTDIYQPRDKKPTKLGTWNSLGEVEGRLIDDDGVHWHFKSSRVQE